MTAICSILFTLGIILGMYTICGAIFSKIKEDWVWIIFSGVASFSCFAISAILHYTI